MDLASLTAADLLRLADEEVAPLAAEVAADLADRSPDALREALAHCHRLYDRGQSRTVLLQLVATALAALGAAPRTAKLYQSGQGTRPVRVSRDDFHAYRIGALRHAEFTLGTYEAPHVGEVLRLLEADPQWTGRDFLVEVLHVQERGGERAARAFCVSVRPWRGAGTESFDAALLRDRARATSQRRNEELPSEDYDLFYAAE